MFRTLSVLLLLLLAGASNAQSFWSKIAEHDVPKVGERRIIPQTYQTFRLDLTALESLLATTPERFTSLATADNQPILTLPMPDGHTSRFRLTESSVMAPELQEKYPEIRSYTGRSLDDPTALLKCDLTPWGFHAMVISAAHNTIFIDPYSLSDREHYVVYFKKDYLPKNDDTQFFCETETTDSQELDLNESAPQAQGDCQLRRYRLALACTGEYANFHGGTKPLVLAAMNTTMNRVNGIYENDFAVTMQIIANNDLLIYLDAGSDPYSNGNGTTMLGQNQTTCTSVIGAANYDIGHVFSTGGGGVASLGVVCNTNNKAKGVTGGSSPVGDAFDVDYVAHEMGHQFDAPHTFNGTAGSCNGNGSSADAVEPGSGTTIMAYAGICGAQDVQNNSDDYFHANSIQYINNFTVSGSGNSCPVKINTGNNNPTVNAGPDYTIPKSTPFALTATGGDINGDTLTHCWEQMDAGLTPNPPAATSATGPLFRSFKGVASPTRWFPRLSDLVTNTNYAWEELPGVARTMNFRVTVRDNNDGAGCTDEEDVVLTVAGNAGPFVVIAPNTNVLWYVGEAQTVTWDVSNTTAAPVNCANVRILLSTDGGFTYPVVLAASAPNSGSANVVVPNNLSNTCRVKVEAVGNIFFDISNQNFRIQQPPVPTFTLSTNISDIQACAGDTVSFTVNIASVLGFGDPVQLELIGAPAGASVQINPNPATPGGSATVTIFNLTPAMAGNYALTVQGTSGFIVQNTNLQLTLLPGPPTVVSLISPADGATGLLLTPILTWTNAPVVESYLVQLATSPSFAGGNLIFSQTTENEYFKTPVLQIGAVYYWRVRAENNCGASAFSPTFSFQTGNLTCDEIFVSTDVPKTISEDSLVTIVSNLNVPVSKTLADVDVALIANHTYVGDLSAKLIAPSGDTVLLFDRPGVPATTFGCSGDNLILIFDDQADQTAADLDATCNSVFPSLLGNFQSLDTLGNLRGQNVQGVWKISMLDIPEEDGGSLNAWSLTFCYDNGIPPGNLATNNPLTVPQGGNGTISNTYLTMTLSGNDDQGKFILLSLPQHGTLTLNGTTLGVGGTFTQADINSNLVVYKHNGDTSLTDNFKFDALDRNNFAWVHNATFNINIIQNNLSATAAQTQAVSCHNGASGEITVAATGLNGQYEYSLNGGPNQSSNVFSDLLPGTYTVVVTGQFGFTATSNVVTLTNPPAIMVSTSVNNDDVTVTASGGTGTLQYSLDGVNFQAGNVFQNLPNGVYTVTVRDANGCTATAQAIVAVNTLIVTLNVQTPISCFGGNNGSIVVTVGGGQAPFSYSLNGGAFQPNNIFGNLSAGNYTVVVKDNQGFTATTNAVTLTNPPAISVSASSSLNVITVTASGGTGTLQYSLDGVNFQSGNVFQNLVNGIYTVTVRDANGCTATTQATVNVPPLVIVALNNTQPILCFGDQTAALEIIVNGGVPPYEYSLNNSPFQSSNIFTNLNAGPHTIGVRDAAGTTVFTLAFFLSQPPPLELSVVVNGNDVTVGISGGTPPVAVSCTCPIPPVNLPNGDYTLVVTDVNGCTDVENFTINVPPLTATVEIVSIDPCAGSAVIQAVAAGGEPPYQYSLNGAPFQSSPTFTVFAGPNNVRVRDANGIIVQVPVNVPIPEPISLAATTSGDTIFASAQFGQPPYQYSIDGQNFQPSPIFPDLSNGTYLVMVRDSNACIDTASATINVIGVVEPGEAWGLAISPNPSAGLFQMAMQNAPATLRAEVFDAVGRRLRTLDFAPQPGGYFNARLDLQDLPQGIYLLRLTDGENWGAIKLSVVR